jgi:hypothetical protein
LIYPTFFSPKESTGNHVKNLPQMQAQIQLDSEGERTKSRWLGSFTVKRILTHADRFAIERMYSFLLPKDVNTSEEMKVRAATIAELAVRIVSGPQWWEGSNSGQMLVDSNPLYDLLSLCADAEEAWNKELEANSKLESTNAVNLKSP